ncbi:MAG: cystathionine beta-lyase [Burkholderiaceae bacterium]
MTRPSRATELLHSDYAAPSGFGSLSTPIHHASTITFRDVASMRARDWRRDDSYTYGLHGTPTTLTLENRIAILDGGEHTVLTPSGLAAIVVTHFALLKAGDAVLLPTNVYAPSRDLGTAILAPLGIEVTPYDPSLGAAVEELVTPATRLLWIESPGSVTMEVADLAALVQVARKHGITTAIDNTWSAGLLLRPFDHGVDVVMHALTKYPSGGSDVLMGSVTTRDRALHERIKHAHMRLGFGVSGDDAYLVLRSLGSLEARLAHHEQAALLVAHWLKGRDEVAQVLHPALEECPGHVFWKRDFLGSGGLFSFILKPGISQDRVDAMVEALKLFRIGYSWGGAMSLAVPYLLSQSRSQSSWKSPNSPWQAGSLVRLFIGLESPSDLIADLAQAFERLAP